MKDHLTIKVTLKGGLYREVSRYNFVALWLVHCNITHISGRVKTMSILYANTKHVVQLVIHILYTYYIDCISTFRPRQKGCHSADDQFQIHFLCMVIIVVWFEFVLNNKLALIKIMALLQTDNKPFIIWTNGGLCVTRPWWVTIRLDCNWDKTDSWVLIQYNDPIFSKGSPMLGKEETYLDPLTIWSSKIHFELKSHLPISVFVVMNLQKLCRAWRSQCQCPEQKRFVV